MTPKQTLDAIKHGDIFLASKDGKDIKRYMEAAHEHLINIKTALEILSEIQENKHYNQ